MDQQHYEGEIDIDIVDYLKIIYKYRAMIIAFVFCAVLLAGISSLRRTIMYQATATFFPLNIRGENDAATLMKPKLDIENLIISLLGSRKMADRVIEQLNLGEVWQIKSISSLRNKLKSMTEISLKKNGIIELAVSNESPALSAQIANAYVDNLESFNRELVLGSQKQIVQVIDRAVVPDQRMPRGGIKKVGKSALMSLFLGIILSFVLEFFKKNKIWQRIRQN